MEARIAKAQAYLDISMATKGNLTNVTYENANNYYANVNAGHYIDIPDALAWFETNIWKAYIFKPYSMFGPSTGPRTLYPKELELLNAILKQLNSHINEKESISEKRVVLYSAFEDNPLAKRCIEHVIQYYSDKVSNPNNTNSYTNKLSRGYGVLGNTSLKSQTRNLPSGPDEYFLIKDNQTPSDSELNLGWTNIFKILSELGQDDFTQIDTRITSTRSSGQTSSGPQLRSIFTSPLAGELFRGRGGRRTKRSKRSKKSRRRSRKN